MSRGFVYGLKKFWSEIFSGDLLILFFSIVLAVTSISSVGFLGDRLKSSMQMQASSILGADLVLRSAAEIDSKYLNLASSLDLKSAETATFLSMIIADEDNLLTSIKAVTPSYPLRGKLTVVNFDDSPIQHSGSPPQGSIWIEKKVSESLELNQSDNIIIGNKNFIVEGIIQDYPDRNSSFVGFYPVAIVNINDVDAMGVIQTGSRVVYRQLFSGTQKNLDRFVESLDTLPPNIRLQNAIDVGDNLGEDIANSTTFFNLASLFTIIISVIAAMMAVRRYASRNLLHTSLMKVFGASKTFILGHQITQLFLLIITASSFGLIFGYALQHLLISTLQGIINADLPPPSFRPVILGLITATFVVFATAAPYIKILSDTEPIRILRNDFTIKLSSNFIIYLVAFFSMFGFLGILFQDLKLIFYIVITLVVVTFALYSIGRLLLYALSFMQFSNGTGWKLGLKNLVQRGNESILQVIIFGLSLLFLVVLAETRTDLVDSWSETLDEDTPNYFLFNIQEYNLKPISNYFEDQAQITPDFTPLIRGRLLSAKRPGSDVNFDNLMDREANLTWQNLLPVSNKLVAGKWWTEGDEVKEVSVDQEIAASMDLEIGDELTFSAGGKTFSVSVTSFREIEWQSFSPNFFFILSPAAGKELPNSYITSIKVKDSNKLMNNFVATFPTITSVNLEAIINQAKNSISSASLAVQYIFLLTLIAGVLALIASIYANKDQRTKEAAIMHAIGASRAMIFKSAASEFFILGILSATTAVIFSTLLSSVIFYQFLDLIYSPNILILGLSFLLAITFIFVAGVLSIRKSIYASPMITLRDS
ncbi:FtsX-like permease family protein [Gammaproteobacteria bacterium]|nr:FtsX-like permease family protein [Gammaproteobacteria bacterium]MDA9799623.1 FtsX-like permease family protein [Gammaproteobacteria bacterium]